MNACKHGYILNCPTCHKKAEYQNNQHNWGKEYTISFDTFFLDGTVSDTTPQEVRTLTAAILRDIHQLTDGLEGWKGGEELPKPQRDLTTYAHAYESARENCPHENTTELLWHKQYKCEDCLSIVPYAAIKKRGWFD